MSAISGTGMTMRIIPQTTYTFDNLAAGTDQVIIIAQHIDVGPFEEVDFMVRCYTGGFGSAGCKIEVLAIPDGWTPESPTTRFLDNAAATTVLLDSSISLPFYSSTALSSGFGRLLTIGIMATQATPPVACNAVLSIDLAMKGGDPSGIMPSFNTYRGYR